MIFRRPVERELRWSDPLERLRKDLPLFFVRPFLRRGNETGTKRGILDDVLISRYPHLITMEWTVAEAELSRSDGYAFDEVRRKFEKIQHLVTVRERSLGARPSEQPTVLSTEVVNFYENSTKNPRSLNKRLEEPLAGSSRGNGVLHHHLS